MEKTYIPDSTTDKALCVKLCWWNFPFSGNNYQVTGGLVSLKCVPIIGMPS